MLKTRCSWRIIIIGMGEGDKGRLVYSTGKGRTCPDCEQAVAQCLCTAGGSGSSSLPASKIVAKLRIETKGRGGKCVTVVDGLPRSGTFLSDLARELKRSLGTGGSVEEGSIQLQGDRRESLRSLLSRRGFQVKG